MLSPVLVGAAGGFALLAVALWPERSTDALADGRMLASLVAVHSLLAFGIGIGLADALGGWQGVLALVIGQLLLLGPTLYATWRLETSVVGRLR